MSILGQLRKTTNVLAVLGVSGLASRIICACSGSMLLFRFFQPRKYSTNSFGSLPSEKDNSGNHKYDGKLGIYNFLNPQDVNLFIYNKLIDIINGNPINSDTQIKIERFLIDQYSDLATKREDVLIMGVRFNKFTGEYKKYCFEIVDRINFYLDNFRQKLNCDDSLKEVNILTKERDIFDYYIKVILNELKSTDISGLMLYVLYIVVTYENILDIAETSENKSTFKISLLKNSLFLGEKLSTKYINYMKSKNNMNKGISFLKFKESFLSESKNNVLSTPEFHLNFGSKLIEIMTTIGVLKIKVVSTVSDSGYSEIAVLTITDKIGKFFEGDNPIAVLPLNLPMIVKPKPLIFEGKYYGGYLLNGVEYDNPLFTNKLSYGVPTTIEKDNVIVDGINNMMSTSFKVNKDLLIYLLENNHRHKLLKDPNFVHKYANIKRNRQEDKEYKGYLSERMLEQQILLIADVYSRVPEFYFPIKLDHRGRFYPNTAFFNYQGCELAKALLLFSKPDFIKRTDSSAIEYLKAYGANCFGNGLNKKSYVTKSKWVTDN